MEKTTHCDKALTGRTIAGFIGLFLALYAAAFAIAELTIARSGMDTAFQKLLAARGSQVGWLVLGSSHALPLDYGNVPERLALDTGQTMRVLAEIGAGPLYIQFVFRQALRDLAPANILYILDTFAFYSPQWNETRIADRKLLRQTPLRLSTAAIMTGMVLREGVDARGLADYLTGFSKLNPPDRFPQGGWRGADTFDRVFRLSRHAVASRIDYLYPEGVAATDADRYLNILMDTFSLARAAGVHVTVVRLPLPETFRSARPDDTAFQTTLRERLDRMGIAYHDLSEKLDDPRLYFDTDHLNRDGIDALYRDHLLELLSAGGDLSEQTGLRPDVR